MKNLLKSGQILGRDEMKKIMAGSGSNNDCWIPCDVNQGWKICCCANGGGTCVETVSECWSYCQN